MKVWKAFVAGCVMVAVASSINIESVSGQVSSFEPGDAYASFQVMAEYLSRDGGRWRAPNPNFDGSSGSPPEFGLWFERDLNDRILQIQIVVHYPKRTVVASRGQWIWHPGSQEVRYFVVHRGGGVTEGVTTFPSGAMFRTVATRIGANGQKSEHRDDNVLVGASVHRNETFQLQDGRTESGGVYEWRRVGGG